MQDDINVEESEVRIYTGKECSKIVDYLMDLRKDLIQEFFTENEIQYRSKDKRSELRNLLVKALEVGQVSYENLVQYLSVKEPLNKQHIFLYNGSSSLVENWRNEDFFTKLIEDNDLEKFIDAPLPILPPHSLSISSISYSPGELLEIYVLERLDHFKRKSEHDKTENIGNEEIIFKAVTHRLDRGLIRFKWDLVGNTASLHISQLPTGYDYNALENNFKGLINFLLDFDTFEKLNLRLLIKKLHELEEQGLRITRSHNLNYQSPSRRTYSARSPSNEDSVISDDDIDRAFRSIRDRGAGHIGNFFWLPSSEDRNILAEEVHTMIIGEEGRINFFSPNKKEDIDYVLSRVRELSR